jgi:transcriptional regulator with XRE-family HTH domain
MNNSTIKDNLRRIRKERRITQEDMAFKLGISLTAYRDLERGNTSMVNANLIRSAQLLETSTEEIVLGYKPAQLSTRKLEEMESQYSGRISELEKEVEYLRKLVKSLEETVTTKNQVIEMLQK